MMMMMTWNNAFRIYYSGCYIVKNTYGRHRVWRVWIVGVAAEQMLRPVHTCFRNRIICILKRKLCIPKQDILFPFSATKSPVSGYKVSVSGYKLSCFGNKCGQALKRKALMRPRKTYVDGADCGGDTLGRLFDVRTTAKVRAPTWTAVYDGQPAIVRKERGRGRAP